MIKNIIYVEDGSVDVDLLEEELGNDTKVIVYRQGSKPPEIRQLEEPIKLCIDEQKDYIKQNIEKLKRLCQDLYPMKKSKKVDKILQDIYSIVFTEFETIH